MVLALEPMITEGDWHVKYSKDGWGIETADAKLSAHFEHTVAVTKDGFDILTQI
jgi:methionyl aminopeptidase